MCQQLLAKTAFCNHLFYSLGNNNQGSGNGNGNYGDGHGNNQTGNGIGNGQGWTAFDWKVAKDALGVGAGP